MNTKLRVILTLLLAFVVQISFAQFEKTITGTVVDEEGLPLPGVNIVVKGTTKGVQTDFDGKFSINASQGEFLVFSFIGLQTAEYPVGESDVLNVTLSPDAAQLSEVVVTALGIKREKQALGYAVSEVNEEQLQSRAEGDIGRVLNGKASGINITQQSGLSGSGTNIVIRGLSSFSASNQPLFIVDGVPFASDTNAQGDFVDGNTGSSRFLDLDPNNIANVSVLKGLAAATLYGTQGRNGVILITTKSGSTAAGVVRKNEITISNSFFFNEVASLADYTDKFGNGFDQSFGWFFSNWGPSFEREGVAGYGNSNTIAADGTIPHPYSTTSVRAIREAFPELQDARYEWRPYNSVEDFFRTGTVKTTSINARGASTDGSVAYNMNYSYLEDEGFTPGNVLRRNNFGIGGSAALSNNFTISGTLSYSNTQFKTPPVAASTGNGAFGGGSSIFGELFFTPRSVDLMGLPYQSPVDGRSVYYRQGNDIQHPLWTVYNAQNSQLTNRIFGNFTTQYAINDHLNLVYRLGIDVYSENNTNQQNRGGTGQSDAALNSGIYETWNNLNYLWDHNIILNGDYKFDKVGVTFNAGATSRREMFDQNGVASSGQQVFDVFRHFNFQLQDEIQFFSERNILGVYGQAEVDYNRMFYLTVAGRNDWVSNLDESTRSIFYPSASFSFVPTTLLRELGESDIVNYMKIRGGYGTSATFPTGYPVAATLSLNTQFFNRNGRDVVVNTLGSRLGNPQLKPETLEEYEVGVEARLLWNRVNLDASFYKRVTNDLIVDRPLDPSTGFTVTSTNVGEIQAEGVEVDLGVSIIESDNEGGFNWSVNTNWTTNDAIVTDLGVDSDIIVYAGFTNLGNAAKVGEQLGIMVGNRIQRDENNNFVVNAAGDYIIEQGLFKIGDPNPDYVLNVNNTFRFKNFSFDMLWIYVKGGDIYSRTASTLLGRGLTTDTEDRLNSFILPGVNQDGSPNTTMINNSTYYFNNIVFGPDELGVFDATTIRLQEVSLGYALPKKALERTPFGSLTFKVSGYNMYYNAVNIPEGTNFDPNVAGLGVGNGQGFEYLNGPSSKRYGLSINASF